MAANAEVHSIPDLMQLGDKTFAYIRKVNHYLVPIQYLYRNKNKEIFDKILQTGGIMKPYLKDNCGDPKCPINGHLEGLCFSATLRFWNNQWQLPNISPFGDSRLLVPAQQLVNNNCNLYFADFYCSMNNHYVILVVAIQGTPADLFCRAKLPPLNLQKNPFMKIDDYGNVHVIHASSLWVEVFYTSDINIQQYHEGRSIQYEQFGRCEFGKLVRKRHCPHCNL